jgi:hypothetical protein
VVERRPRNLQVLTHPEWWLDHDDYPGRRWFHGVQSEALRKWERYDADLKALGRENLVGLPADCVAFLEDAGPRGRAALQHWISGDADTAFLLLWQMRQLREPGATSDAESDDRLVQHSRQVVNGDAVTTQTEICALVELLTRQST